MEENNSNDLIVYAHTTLTGH